MGHERRGDCKTTFQHLLSKGVTQNKKIRNLSNRGVVYTLPGPLVTYPFHRYYRPPEPYRSLKVTSIYEGHRVFVVTPRFSVTLDHNIYIYKTSPVYYVTLMDVPWCY